MRDVPCILIIEYQGRGSLYMYLTLKDAMCNVVCSQHRRTLVNGKTWRCGAKVEVRDFLRKPIGHSGYPPLCNRHVENCFRKSRRTSSLRAARRSTQVREGGGIRAKASCKARRADAVDSSKDDLGSNDREEEWKDDELRIEGFAPL